MQAHGEVDDAASPLHVHTAATDSAPNVSIGQCNSAADLITGVGLTPDMPVVQGPAPPKSTIVTNTFSGVSKLLSGSSVGTCSNAPSLQNVVRSRALLHASTVHH